MNPRRWQRSDDALFFFFALFILGSTFSIALAQVSLGLALVLFVVIAVGRRYNPFASSLKPFYVLVGAYIAWEFVAALAGETPSRSAWILKEDWLFCIVPVGVYLLAKERYREHMVTAFAVGVLVISIYGLLQHFFGWHWTKESPPVAAPDYGYLVRGSFSHRLTFGNYYGTAALFIFGLGITGIKRLSSYKRTLLITASLLAVIATILTYSRGVTVGIGVTLVMGGVLLGRKYLTATLGTLVVAIFLVVLTQPGLVGRFGDIKKNDLDVGYEGGRLFIWENSLVIAGEHPLFGVGAGNFEFAYTALLRPDIPHYRKHVHAHNDLLNIAATTGLPGLAFFGGMWLLVLGYFWAGRRNGRFSDSERRFCLAALLGSVVFFITSLVEATFADEEVRQMLMFVWAAGLWPWYKQRDQLDVVDY